MKGFWEIYVWVCVCTCVCTVFESKDVLDRNLPEYVQHHKTSTSKLYSIPFHSSTGKI